MDWKLFSQQCHHYLCYSLMAILYDNNCTACNSFTFSSQKVRLGLMILNLRKIRGLMTCSPTPFQGILEMQLSVNEGKQHLPSSGLSDWENSLELSWLENPLASFKINFNSSILAILGGL
ncbi:hypothetical protein POUND7_006870 [Theobroma cacao]